MKASLQSFISTVACMCVMGVEIYYITHMKRQCHHVS